MDLSYNTVYKWWDLTEDDFHAFESRHEFVLDNYRQYFIEQLKVTPQMNNTLLYKRLKDDFGDEVKVLMSTFHRYIKSLREQTGYVKPQRKTGLRDDAAPGYEAQVDYGQYAMKSIRRRHRNRILMAAWSRSRLTSGSILALGIPLPIILLICLGQRTTAS